MNTQYTPGPWRNPSGSVSVFAFHNRKVCDTCWHNKPSKEAEANARLIAAAPELLEALQDLLLAFNPPPYTGGSSESALEHYNSEVDQMRTEAPKKALAIIAKATNP